MPNLNFRSSFMGYSKDEVNEYIASVERRFTAQIDELMRETGVLRAKNQELEQSSITQAEVLSGGAHHMHEMDEALNKERLRGDQFESMYASVTERNELLQSDIRRLQAEREQAGGISDLLQRQIIELKHENERLLNEIRNYEKQRALVAELELKAYKRAKDLEYSVSLAFERSKSELQKNLELAGSAFDEFRIHTSRLSTQAISDMDSMKDSFSYLTARINEVGERLGEIRDMHEDIVYDTLLGNVLEPETAGLSNISPLVTPVDRAVDQPAAQPIVQPAEQPSPLSDAQSVDDNTQKDTAPEPSVAPPEVHSVSQISAGIVNPFADIIQFIQPEIISPAEFQRPAETPEPEPEPMAEITLLPAFNDDSKSDFDAFFDSYLKSRVLTGPTDIDDRQEPHPLASLPDSPSKDGADEPRNSAVPVQSQSKTSGGSNWFDYSLDRSALLEN